MNSSWRKSPFNIDLLLLVSVAVLINLPFFDPRVLPVHDTLHSFSMFHYFYSGFYFDLEIPLWLQYGVYGMPAAADQIITLQPASYFVGLIGALLNIPNALFLFKVSILIDELIFLTGLYLLCRSLFVYRLTVFMVCLSGLCSSVWLVQINFGFIIYYLTPYIFYFIIRFFEEKKPEFLWIGGMFTVLSLIGSYAYLGSVYLLMVTIFTLVPVAGKKPWQHVFSTSWKNILSFLVMASMLGIYIYFMMHAIDFITVYHETGQMKAGETIKLAPFPVKTFLTHGQDMIKTFKFPEFLSGMRIHQTPVSLYIGILPLVFFIVSAIKVRKIYFAALFIAAAVLVGLSFGGIIAAGLYFFPGMFFFRHIGHIYGLIKLILLICAGFGIDYFFERFNRIYAFIKTDKRFSSIFSISDMAVIFVCYLFFVDIVISYHFHNFSVPETVKADMISAFVFSARVLFYIAAGLCIIRKILKSEGLDNAVFQTIKIIIVACLAFDLFSFQAMAYLSVPFLDSSRASSLDCFDANRMIFQAQRTNNPFEARQEKIANLFKQKTSHTHYHHSLQGIMQLDSCCPEKGVRNSGFSLAVDGLIRIRGGFPVQFPKKSYLPQYDLSFLRSIGCESPKLRLVSSSKTVETIEAAANILKTTMNLDDFVVLRDGRKNMELLEKPIIRTIDLDKIAVDNSLSGDNVVSLFYESDSQVMIDFFWETTEPFPHWLRFDFGFPQKVSAYFLESGPYGKDSTGRMPMDWELQGSNDLRAWQVIDRQSVNTKWRNLERRRFNVSNAQPYRYYRFLIQSVIDDKILRLRRFGFQINHSDENKTKGFGFKNGSNIKIIEFSANRLRLKIESDKENYLVYADSFHPGWKAYVDGKPVPIMEANLAFKALKLKPGTNDIVFKFFDGFNSAVCFALAVLGVGFTVGVLVTLWSLIFLNPYYRNFP